MPFPIYELPRDRYPPKLLEIPDPPTELFVRGQWPDISCFKTLAVVGARAFSPYGKDVCDRLIGGLRGYPMIIVSGLALGIDSLAHEAALRTDLKTIAVPGSGLDPEVIYPPTHLELSEKILAEGGCLLSEFPPWYKSTIDCFPARNRIMAGLSDATLIIEAEIRSGTMITARLATDYNRDLLVVPGSIFSKNSEGNHQLIRQGAIPITSSKDILEALGLKSKSKENDLIKYRSCSPEELMILEKIQIPISRDNLLENLDIPVSKANSLLTILELKDLIVESGGEIHLK